MCASATLKNHAEKYGTVSHHQIIMDKATGKSRGFGFVTFARKEDADKFLEDEHTLDGRTVGASAITIFKYQQLISLFGLDQSQGGRAERSDGCESGKAGVHCFNKYI